jgi:hypothetical protein
MSSSGLVGAIGSPGDRIQLAPLRAGHGGATATSPQLPHTLPGPIASGGTAGTGGGAGYAVIQMRSNSRGGNGTSYGGGPREGVGERDRERGTARDSERGGKKNPLSIGSIISEETG